MRSCVCACVCTTVQGRTNNQRSSFFPHVVVLLLTAFFFVSALQPATCNNINPPPLPHYLYLSAFYYQCLFSSFPFAFHFLFAFLSCFRSMLFSVSLKKKKVFLFPLVFQYVY
ncbi:MAG: hypothetical protein J3R72DRAFT_53702 [Linnemannia gamsii]|nr:MAG: hypothetical protein J3R72DRAFT_53702 [Linnemannia gamsii]